MTALMTTSTQVREALERLKAGIAPPPLDFDEFFIAAFVKEGLKVCVQHEKLLAIGVNSPVYGAPFELIASILRSAGLLEVPR